MTPAGMSGEWPVCVKVGCRTPYARAYVLGEVQRHPEQQLEEKVLKRAPEAWVLRQPEWGGTRYQDLPKCFVATISIAFNGCPRGIIHCQMSGDQGFKCNSRVLPKALTMLSREGHRPVGTCGTKTAPSSTSIGRIGSMGIVRA